jgi:hypothetical protein
VRRALARCVLLLVLAAPAVVTTASPCAACSCAPRSPTQLFRQADAAFIGSVVDQQAIDQTTTVQTFAVRSIFKGPLGSTVNVIEPIGSGGGDTCGLLYGPGEVAVILYRQWDGWTTDVCSGITVAQLTGVGPPPVHPSPPAVATPTVNVAPASGGSGGVGWPAAVIGLLAGIAAIALMLSFVTRRDGAESPPVEVVPPGHRSSPDERPEAGPSG